MELQPCSGGEDVTHVWSCVIETDVHTPLKNDMVLIGGAIFNEDFMEGKAKRIWNETLRKDVMAHIRTTLSR